MVQAWHEGWRRRPHLYGTIGGMGTELQRARGPRGDLDGRWQARCVCGNWVLVLYDRAGQQLRARTLAACATPTADPAHGVVELPDEPGLAWACRSCRSWGFEGDLVDPHQRDRRRIERLAHETPRQEMLVRRDR